MDRSPLRVGTLGLLCLLLVVAGCQLPQGDDPRRSRYRYAEVASVAGWKEAGKRLLTTPSQAVPAAVTLAGMVFGFAKDDATRQYVYESGAAAKIGSTALHDDLNLGLGVAALSAGLFDWAHGDKAVRLEATLESLVLTEVVAYGLKAGSSRHRPNRASKASFPSSHSSFAFSTATSIARACHDTWGDGWGHLGYLAYVPASFVAAGRLAGDRHHLSDVAGGACLGITLTHLVHNLHYPENGMTTRIVPVFDGDYSGLSMSHTF